MIREQRITIVRIRKPVKHNLNQELQWIGDSLGLFSQRDKDKSCFRIFIVLLKAAKQNIALSSDDVALRTGLTRGTVVFHLNKLIDGGLVISKHNRYILRVGNLQAVIEEVQKDLNRTCDDLKKMAKRIDEQMS
tara:strand:- start:226 stop:627 length:402 start_codon:yes stop_codon:yes gene_type:complete